MDAHYTSGADFDGRVIALQKLLYIPTNFFYDVLPPVAISLLTVGLGGNRKPQKNSIEATGLDLAV